jgi:Ser/Thr protein kinase RdoA (MazF antagonist)
VRHGGWLAPLWGPYVLGLRRPLAELETTARLRAKGAPVPRPALVLGRRRRCLWEAWLGTVHEEGSVDGIAFLRATRSAGRVRRAARAAGRAVRRLHDAGGRHADLHLGNLLVQETKNHSQVLVIDLDRARAVGEIGPRRRMAELMRLYRSLRKRGLLDPLGRRACAAFFGAYAGGDRGLRRALLRHLPRERVRVGLHALAYPRRAAPDRDVGRMRPEGT